MSSIVSIQQDVSEYYGKILSRTEDLKTNACTTSAIPPLYVRKAMSNIHDEVMAKYYGCGTVVPEALTDLKILDLGCGSGKDVYALAQFVGEKGEVVGVDMTIEQLQVARSHEEWHRTRFGYSKSNVR
jgi:arsenite methyltransferase